MIYLKICKEKTKKKKKKYINNNNKIKIVKVINYFY